MTRLLNLNMLDQMLFSSGFHIKKNNIDYLTDSLVLQTEDTITFTWHCQDCQLKQEDSVLKNNTINRNLQRKLDDSIHPEGNANSYALSIFSK